MITVYDFEQRSAEWEDARRGMVTASMVGKLISIGPPEPTATGCPTCGAGASAPGGTAPVCTGRAATA